MPKSRAATKILVLHEGMIGDISFDADVVRATLANGQRVTAKLAAAPSPDLIRRLTCERRLY
jgi:hypothetical protein